MMVSFKLSLPILEGGVAVIAGFIIVVFFVGMFIVLSYEELLVPFAEQGGFPSGNSQPSTVYIFVTVKAEGFHIF